MAVQGGKFVIQPTVEENQELLRLNEELQKLEEEVDVIVHRVNEKRLTVPEDVLELFELVKETKLSSLEGMEPEGRENMAPVENVDDVIDRYMQSTSMEDDAKELEEKLTQMDIEITNNDRHTDLLYAGLTENSPFVPLEACYLTKIGDPPF